jgi:hypothetical protein
MTDDLSPLPRLNARQLYQLAQSLRHHGGAADRVSESVAAALESVSRRRATDQPWAMLLHFCFAAKKQSLTMVRVVAERIRRFASPVESLTLLGRVELAAPLTNPVAMQTVQRRAIAPGRENKVISLCPSTVKQALTAVELGHGLSPDVCDALIARRWVEWVDYRFGTPIDPHSPRSVLRLTEEGYRQFGVEPLSSNESAFTDGRLAV